MTSKEKGVKIGRIVSALRIANTELNEANPHRNKLFDEGETFFCLAFMSDAHIEVIDTNLFI